MNIDISETIKP